MIFFVAAACSIASAGTDSARLAQSILQRAGVESGLIVHVGCDSGRLTAALRAGKSNIVHGLERDPKDVKAARQHIRSRGLYGPISVAHWNGERLPYVTNTVNLLLCENPSAVSDQEIDRVLAPGGTALLRKNDRWEKQTKDWPQEIDEWTHYLHDPSNNAVSSDQQVGPPRHMQWRARPLWCRYHHTLASISTVVSSSGRLFYVADLAPPASMNIKADWHILARDAFNGKLLWKKDLPSWAWYKRGFRSGPPQLPRLMVASDEQVYAPLGLGKPVSALDADTGRVIRTFQQTGGAEEILLVDNTLLVVRGSPAAEQAVKHPLYKQDYRFPNRKSIVALDVRSGRRLWQWKRDEGDPLPMTLASDGERTFFQTARGVTCLDLRSGTVRWRWKAPDGSGGRGRLNFATHTLVVSGGVVLCKVGNELTALSAGTGTKLWDCQAGAGFHAPVDVFAIDGKVWQGQHPKDSVAPPPVEDFARARDLHTGRVESTNQLLVGLQSAGHHHRCYREKATERYIITGKRGVEFMDLAGDNHSRNNWLRGSCQYGIMPANGLTYAPPHCCGCYMEAKLYGFWATAPKRRRDGSQADQPRLKEGPAYDTAQEKGDSGSGAGWPTYRHDITRSGSTEETVSSELSVAWRTEVGEKLTPPVVADGLAVVCSKNDQRVTAVNTSDGSVEWTFTPGGPVDLPPTLHRNLVLFGCRDGHVYCLRAYDGQLVWRFRAAPRDRRTLDRERLESVWPVPGSVLIMDGVAYVSAGRSTYLDGGVSLFGLDPWTGRIVCRNRVESEHAGLMNPEAAIADKKVLDQNIVNRASRRAPDRSDSFSMKGGTLNDALVSDGHSIYLKQMRFGPELGRRKTSGRHLFSTSRLLNTTEVHRSHWVLGTGDFSGLPVAYSWIANRRSGRGKMRLGRPYGILLAFEPDTAWGVWRRMNKPGYTIYAQPKKPFRREPEGRPDFRTFEEHGLPDMKWKKRMLMRPRAMLKAGQNLFFGGGPDQSRTKNALAAYRGKKGGLLWVYSAAKGEKQGAYDLSAPVTWNGMAAADERLYASLANGRLVCLRPSAE